MHQDLKDRVAVITGGSKGIGKAIAEACIERGMRVAIGARNEEEVRAVAADLSGGQRHALGVRCDVRVEADCRNFIDQAADKFGRIDVLVNNAGIGRFGPVADLDPDDWRAVIETNLNGVFYCTHAAIPHLRRGGGWIINIASLAGKNAFPGGGVYNASKFGLVGFSEALMQEVRQDGIRVSYIMPGSVATDFSHPAGGSGDEAWKIQPEDIGRIVMDLLDTPERTLPSRVEVRPSRPPSK
jgi:3-oxoacyl-[acyl-carrier protein] reductase